jgi:hypothetical protein
MYFTGVDAFLGSVCGSATNPSNKCGFKRDELSALVTTKDVDRVLKVWSGHDSPG